MGLPPPPIDHASHQQHTEITARLARIGLVMPGSLTQRHTRCSSRGCHCHTDPDAMHGPYWAWTRKINNKTVSTTITAHDAQRYATWFANARELRRLATELETLTLAIAQANGWGEK